MKQANYKTLLLKLAGTGIGLVAMLTIASNVGQNLLMDKSGAEENADGYVYADAKKYTPRYVTLDKAQMEADRQKQKMIRLETEKWQNIKDLGIRSAQIAAEALQLVDLENLMNVQITNMDDLNSRIELLSERHTIPSAIKYRILSKLDHQLRNTELKLTLLEDQVLKFSFKNHFASKYNYSAKCSGDYNIFFRKKDPGTSTKKAINKGPLESFYWI